MSAELIGNRFLVLEELGHGGMGTVYRVRDTLGERAELALKTFRSDVPITPERRLRFREEFRAMSRLRHPNTIEVFDCGFLDGSTEYLTMELVPGRELSDILLDGPLPFEQIYEHALQLLLALEFIHSRLYVHRDLKPSNLRVRPDGVLKVMDFGLMQWLGNNTFTPGMGTAAYMAPEAIVGGTIEATTDLYSVGCVIYEMATGRPPFLGTKTETLRAHLSETPRTLRSYRPDTPAEFDELVARLLAKDARDRYGSAAEVADEIARLAGVHHLREDLQRNESYLISDVMIGREQEFGVLEQLAQQTERGYSRAVFIAGPAGIGKTRLLYETLIQAKLRGTQVVHARCKLGMNPYEALANALRPLLSLSSPEDFARHTAISERLDRAASDLVGGNAVDAGFDKQVLAEDVSAWLAAITSRTPVVFAVEDLQWCDLPSVELFNHVIRNAERQRLLCAATLRNDETSLGSPVWFTVQDGQTELIKLEAFDEHGVRTLVESMLHLRVTDEFIEALYAATAGNPFFITEVMRDLMEQRVLLATEDGSWSLPSNWRASSLPASIEAVVLERLGRLSPATLELARVAAVLDNTLDRESLLTLSEVDEDVLLAGIEALTERQFLTRNDKQLAFPHDRVREALYASTPIERRRELHRRCAEYIEQRHANELDTQVAALAFHYTRAEEHGKALEYTLRAADAAKLVGAEVSAVDYWNQARELLANMDHAEAESLRFEIDAKLAENAMVLFPAMALEAAERCRTALEARGNIDRVTGALKKAVAVVHKLPQGARTAILADMTRARPYRHRSRRGLLGPPVTSWAPKLLQSYVLGCVAAGMAGEPNRGLQLGERALALLPFRGTPLEGAMCCALAGCQISAGHIDANAELCARARELLFEGDLGDDSVLRSARIGAAVFTNQKVFQGLRFDPNIVEFGERAIAEFTKPDFYNQIWAFPGMWYAFTGRQREATALLEQIEDNCRRIGSPPYPWALYLKPFLAYQRGAFDEARGLVDLSLRYAHIDRMMLAREYACVLDGHINLAVAEYGIALDKFGQVERRARQVGMDLVVVLALLGRAEVLTKFGEFDLARMALDEALRQTAGGPTRNPLQHAIGTRLLADLLIRLGDYDEAEAALRRATTIMTSPAQDNLIEQAHLLRTSAELALARRDSAEALALLVQAEAKYTDIGNKYFARLAHARRLSAGLTTDEEPHPSESGVHPITDMSSATPDAQTAEIVAPTTWVESDTNLSPDAETPADGVSVIK